MAKSLVERCHEVMNFLDEKRAERLRHAKALLQARGKDQLLHAIPFLQLELLMHQEVRTLWPYLLAIPDREETRYFCDMYECKLEDLGKRVQTRINEMIRFLDVIENKLHKTYPPGSFWVAIREELLAKICREARKVLEE
ncbi:hypothetical protein [Effusibacillus pohliae]|uniref:hypothetical protein n=1 Tax=Effusibacillus pohliae TaxID=232270 RepID=UPI0003706022|nr:hypothetical protein [Effusibacillus pohliae]